VQGGPESGTKAKGERERERRRERERLTGALQKPLVMGLCILLAVLGETVMNIKAPVKKGLIMIKKNVMRRIRARKALQRHIG